MSACRKFILYENKLRTTIRDEDENYNLLAELPMCEPRNFVLRSHVKQCVTIRVKSDTCSKSNEKKSIEDLKYAVRYDLVYRIILTVYEREKHSQFNVMVTMFRVDDEWLVSIDTGELELFGYEICQKDYFEIVELLNSVDNNFDVWYDLPGNSMGMMLRGEPILLVNMDHSIVSVEKIECQLMVYLALKPVEVFVTDRR